jgi:hypothetical protein
MEYNRHIPWLWNRPTWLNDGKLLKALQYTIWVLQTNRQTWNQRKIMLARYLVPWNATKELSNVIAYAFEGDILDKVSIILSSRVIYTTNVVIIDHCNQPWLQFFTFTFVLCKSLWLVIEIANNHSFGSWTWEQLKWWLSLLALNCDVKVVMSSTFSSNFGLEVFYTHYCV